MKFDHVLKINDPMHPLIEDITHAQLWRGLVLRARSPMLFIPWLDACDVVVHSPTVLERVLRYGDVKIHDSVTLLPERQIRYEVPSQPDIPASQLVMAIEAPDGTQLDVRFTYDDGVEEIPGSMEAFYNDHRRAAYREADIDTVRIIRQMAGEGRLD
ncbi:MAG: SRPBCC family protein [Pseudomonadota bacterium]